MSPSKDQSNSKNLGKKPIVWCESDSLPQSTHLKSPPNKHNQTPSKTNNKSKCDRVQTPNFRREIDFYGEEEVDLEAAHEPSDTSTFDRVAARLEHTLLEVRNLFAAHDKLVGIEDDKLYPALRMDASKKRAYEVRAQHSSKKRPTGGATVANPMNPTAVMVITIKSDDDGDNGVEFPMTPITTFARVYREYGYLINVEAEDFIIKKGIRVIDEHMTPEQAMVRHGDVLITDGMDPSLNTNTQRRTMTFHQTKDGPGRQLTVNLPVSTRIVELYRTWGDFIGYNTCTFDLVHNEYKLPRFGNLSTHGMKNGCDIYCVHLHPGVGSIGTPSELRST